MNDPLTYTNQLIESFPSGVKSSEPIILLGDVAKIYQTAAGRFIALDGINLKIYSGEFVSIVGKSGSGKTTLINMLTGIDRPTSGEVFVNGSALHDMSEGEIAIWRGANLGVVFQFFQLLPTLTIIENVMLPMDMCNIYTGNQRQERARHLLHLVGLDGYDEQFPNRLSGGQQQSAAIARALANDPPILATDEPTGNLDSGAAENVLCLFDNLSKEGKTILMVTHDQDLASRAGRIIQIVDGVIANSKKLYSFIMGLRIII